MRKMKRIMVLLISLLLALFCAGCGKEQGGEPAGTTLEVVEGQQDVFDKMESIAAENADRNVGSYVIPPESDFTWEETEGGVALTGYTGTITAVEVPAQLGGKDVVEIWEKAFSNVAVVGIKLPDTVTKVGEQAFVYCTSLVEAKMGDGIEIIEADAFHGCLALSKVTLNTGLKTIGEQAFASCSSLKKIEIPNTVTQIVGGAFVLSGLETITIPGSVDKIGNQAFSSTKLTKVIIENGVKTIGECAFEGCSELKRVDIPASVETIEYGIFLYSENVTVYAPAGSAAEAYAQDNNISFKAN